MAQEKHPTGLALLDWKKELEAFLKEQTPSRLARRTKREVLEVLVQRAIVQRERREREFAAEDESGGSASAGSRTPDLVHTAKRTRSASKSAMKSRKNVLEVSFFFSRILNF